ncbi:SOS response-associated peptidase [Adhaeribacter terreus]|uniref:Abasic site processing protein n=1 Tax=Adhaeribacter terreus TaxID=529703 RepID=A0ABW0EDP8_9BACT
MCGRYTISKKQLAKGHRFATQYSNVVNDPNYNAAPSQSLPVITNQDKKHIQLFHWGLIPFWTKELKGARKPINARAETIIEKLSFRSLLKSKRCLVLADSFYEWKVTPQGKVPHRILLKNEELFTFAGLWDEWADKSTGEVLHTFSIITTEANELVHPIHDRMPVILTPEAEELWLNNDETPKELLDLLTPYPAEEMKAYPVSPLVNSPLNNSPELLNSLWSWSFN